jgi:hypothetical protein
MSVAKHILVFSLTISYVLHARFTERGFLEGRVMPCETEYGKI